MSVGKAGSIVDQLRRCRFESPWASSSSLRLPLTSTVLGRLVLELSSGRREEGIERSLIGVIAADGEARSTY